MTEKMRRIKEDIADGFAGKVILSIINPDALEDELYKETVLQYDTNSACRRRGLISEKDYQAIDTYIYKVSSFLYNDDVRDKAKEIISSKADIFDKLETFRNYILENVK